MKLEIRKRKDRLERNLSRIVDCLVSSYDPEKIYLFGSLANGELSENSDLDLLIVKKTDKRFMERLKEVSLLCDYDIGADLIVYTPEEFEEGLKENMFLQQEVVERGKLIYEKSS